MPNEAEGEDDEKEYDYDYETFPADAGDFAVSGRHVSFLSSAQGASGYAPLRMTERRYSERANKPTLFAHRI